MKKITQINFVKEYVPAIDGLRALAILSVVIYHYFPEVMPGGFTGVDIFFVISGYLITKHINDNAEKDWRYLLSFYSKRIRRILPALILVLLATLMLGWLFLFFDEYAALGRQTFYSAIFIPNIALLKESGYFDIDAINKPLLNLWSLGIEEQFYIVWPVLIWSIWRLGKCRFPLIVALIISSFTVPDPKIVKLSGYCLFSNTAVMTLSASITKLAGLEVPVYSPVHSLKIYSAEGVASILTFEPIAYVPVFGVTEPPTPGVTFTVNCF